MGRLIALLFTLVALLIGGSLLVTRLFEIADRAGYSAEAATAVDVAAASSDLPPGEIGVVER